jgi:hypothetical protein
MGHNKVKGETQVFLNPRQEEKKIKKRRKEEKKKKKKKNEAPHHNLIHTVQKVDSFGYMLVQFFMITSAKQRQQRKRIRGYKRVRHS